MKLFKKKEDKTIKGWFIKNQNAFVGGVIGIIIGMLIMTMMWPARIAKLENGEEPIVSVDGLTITADDLYGELKDQNGLNSVLELIDKVVLVKEYNIEEKALKEAKQNAEEYFKQYESYGYSKEQFLSNNGFDDEEAFIDYLKFEYIGNRYYKDYLKSLISDKDIEKFYKKEAFGVKNVIFYSTQSEDNELEKLRKDLKKGVSAEKIEEKYSDINANELSIGITNIASYSEEIIDTLRNMKKGEYSKIIKDDAQGYLVMYVTDTEKLLELKEEKDNIIDAISARLDAEDPNLYNKAYDELRKKYNLKFSDTEMKKEYEKLLKSK